MLCFFITYKYKLMLEILGAWRKNNFNNKKNIVPQQSSKITKF